MVHGGERPYKWEIQGAAPPGFSISETGVLSGASDKPFTTTVVVKCTGSDKKAGTATLKLTIAKPDGSAPPLLTPAPAAGPNSTTGTPKPALPNQPKDDG